MRHKAAFVTIILLACLPLTAYAQAGRPILTVRNYTVTPTPVKPGQEFTVEIEIYNNGSRAGENTMAIFGGGDFMPLGDAGHVLWQLHINHTARVSQQMRAPASLPAGVHRLQIDLSANDYEGNHYDYPQTIPVEVVVPSSGPVSAPPKVVIDGAQTEPALIAPGMPFTLTLRLANQGGRAATALYAGCAADSLAVPVAGSDLARVERIAAGQAVSVTMPLMLAWDVAQGGRQRMAIDLDYQDAAGGTYQETQAIGIEVDAGLIPAPQLIVESYTTEPGAPMPGAPFTLTLRLNNVGTEPARRLALAFGGPEGTELSPFLLANAGHIVFLGDLEPGRLAEVVRQFSVDDAAAPQAYSLPLALSYSDGRGKSLSTFQSLSLIVQPRPVHSPQLVIAAYSVSPDFVAPGDPLTLTLEIANVGTAGAEGLLLALGGQDGALLEPFMPDGSGNVLFVGSLVQGQAVQVTQPLSVDGTAEPQAYNLPIALTYAGPEGTPTSRVQRISLIVRRRVELQVEVYSRPDLLAVEMPAQLSLELLNVGRGPVDVVGLRATALNASLQTEGTPFIGPLDPGGSAPLDLVLTPTRGGTIQLIVHVSYRDDLNRVQAWSAPLAFEVEEGQPSLSQPAAPEQPHHTPAFWPTLFRALKGFVGLGS